MSDLAERIAGLSEEKRQLLELLRKEKRERTRADGERPPGEASASRPFSLVSEEDRRMMPDDVVDAYPLTMLQAGMIYHMEETPEYPLYHNVDSYNLEGRLEHETLVEAINRVVARHPVLRTSFALTAYREPLQLVHERAHLPVGLDDLRHLPVEEQDRIVNAYVEGERRRSFDISRPPLLRFHVHRRTDETYQLTLTEFHPILDGWSLNSTLAEIFNLYFALLNKQPLPDERPLAGTFRDYVVLERKALESEGSKEYWARRLGDASMLELPRWPEAYRDRGGRPIVGLRFPITQALLEQLKRYAQSISVPLKSVLLAAHMKVLGALGGRGDVVTGLSTQGRPETADGDQIRGLFLNILPYRLAMPDGSWTELIHAAFRAERDLMPYRRYPIAAIQKNLGARRFFEVAFNVVQFHVYMDLLESGNKLEMVGTGQEFEEGNFTLMTNFGLHPSGSHLILVLEYHATDLCEEQVRAIAGYYLSTLEAIAADPEAPHQSFNVLSHAERGRILREWNDTRMEAGTSAPSLLPTLFEAQVAETPDAIALTFEGESLTYRELNERANRLAHHLRALGVGAESIVAIMTGRCVELVVGLLATLKAGAAYLPLDPSYPRQRLAFMLADAAPKVLLTQRRLRDLLAVPGGVKVIHADEPPDASDAQSAQNPHVEIEADNLAYIIYTSGSTGTPKGVMVTHGGLSNYLNWSSRAYRLSEGCGAPVHSPLGFDLTVTSLWNPLITGGRVDLLREGEGIEHLSQALLSGADYGVVKITPAHLEALRHVVGEGGEERLKTRCFVIGGEALGWEDVRYWRERHPSVRLVNEYGPTETVVGCCVYEVSADDTEEGAGVPIGRPVGNMQMYVLDEQMQPVPVGVAGELYIGGVALGRGYLKRAALTAERFVPHPYATEPGARLYRTGDVGRYLPDGRLEYLGRRDEQVKIRGFRIELGEIEAALRSHESVREAVVAVRNEEGGHKRLVAYLVASAAGREFKSAELRAYLEARLPEYMIPGKFVEVEQIPLTANGKVNRRALAEIEDAAGTEQRKQSYAAPRTPTEELLAKIWAEALGVERVGVHDNFFELGGDSILILPIIAKAAKSGLKIIPRNIFQHPTIAELADFTNNAKPRAHKREPRRARHSSDATATFPLTPMQQAFFESNTEAPHHFNQSVLLSVPRELTPDILHTATSQLMRRHDALRLRFKQSEGAWHPFVSESLTPSPLTVIDLSGLPADAHSPLIESASDAAQASLDLADGPLLRVLLFVTGQESNRLLIAVHHLAIDGVSWRVLLEDLQLAYRDLRAGRAPELPPLTTPFARWAALLSAHVSSGALAGETDYWLRQASTPAAALPVKETGSAPLLSTARSFTLSLSEGETRSLLQEVPRAYNTQINDVLLAALALAVSAATGSRRLRLDLEGHGREEVVEGVDLSRTVGWFTSVYPVLLDVGGAADEAGALKAVKEQSRAVPNRGVGYGLLKYLGPDARVREQLREARPAQISFNYLGQFDRVLSGGGGFGAAAESAGRSQSPRTRLTHALDISGNISGGQLRLDFNYSPEQLDGEFVEGLMGEYAAALRKLIAHCAGRGRRSHTPSDFPLARVGREELERLAESGAEIEDVYPMSPLQEGLLFHTLQAPGSGVYMQQMSCRFGAGFRVETFKRSWAALVGRHAILRSGYAWEGLEEPLAVVRRTAELEIVEEDWRGRSAEERERRPDEYLREDRARGFDVSRGPLMRLWLMRETDDLYRFVWSMHHLIIDGWSMGLLIKEVFENYEALARGEELERRAERPYRDYIAWLKRQDGGAAEAFWREWLKGFHAPTPLAVEPPAVAAGEEEYAHQVAQYTGAATEELRAFARRQRLTLNTLIQGAWALLLSRYSGERDVVFGVVVSGRPTELAGFESMIGLFVNTLPMRAQVSDEESVVEWLRRLQEAQAEMQQYEHSPLVQVQGWSEVPRGVPLFDSYLNFLNYPIDESLRKSEGPVEIHNASSVGAGSYPLAIDVTPGAALSVEITYDARRFGRAAVARLLTGLETLLQNIVARPDADLRTLGEMLDESDRRARAARDEEQQEALRLKMRTAKRRAVVKGN